MAEIRDNPKRVYVTKVQKEKIQALLSDAIDQELNKQPSGLIARLQRAADDLDRANPVDVCKFGILSLMPQLQLLILKIESL